MSKRKEIPEHTHKVTITLYSDSVDPDVWVQIDWDPQLDGSQIQELGYLPASFKFLQEKVVPMLEEAYSEAADELAAAEPASDAVN